MGLSSVISGYITSNEFALDQNMRAIASHKYDAVYPFTHIFFPSPPPANYLFPVIGFAGSYKQVEEDWDEWLWKFGQLLSRLDALDAVVYLDCILGQYRWRLTSKDFFLRAFDGPRSFLDQEWGIAEAPDSDFTLVAHDWGIIRAERWTKTLPRWDSSPDSPSSPRDR